MAAGKSFPVDVTMDGALSRTNAWVNRAGVVLDPAPAFGNQSQPGLLPKGQTVPSEHHPIPSELASAILQMDASSDQAEHHQAKEQARLLQRFQQLKLWQQQQQDRLLLQQQEQLLMLRLEQQRVEQTLVAQRQKQWGGIQHIQESPPRTRTGLHQHRSPASSPLRSTVPDALAKASISLGQTAGPMVLNPLLAIAQEEAEEGPGSRSDLDSASEVASSVVEEGVYPLPETASEMSFGIVDEELDEGDKEDKERLEKAGETDSAMDESLLDTSSFKQKTNDHPSVAEEPNLDDRPIQSALGSKAKTFEELLEEKLKTDTDKYQSPENPPQPSSESARQPFLRKGAGTARFGIITKKPPRPPSLAMTLKPPQGQESRPAPGKKTSADRPEHSEKHSSGGSQKTAPVAMSKLSLAKPARQEGDGKKADRVTHGKKEEGPHMARKVASKHPATSNPSQDPLSKQVLASQPRQAGHSTGRGTQGPKTPAITVDSVPAPYRTDNRDKELASEGALPDDTIEISFQMRMKEWEQNEKVEQEELDEFELLEEAAGDNTSFTSDASVVVNMMQRANLHKTRHEVPSGTLKGPTKSRPMTEKQGQRDVSRDKPDLSHGSKAHDEQQCDADQDGSLTAGDRTLTGDDENGYSPESKGQGGVGENGRKQGGAGSTTENDSDDMLEEIVDQVSAEVKRSDAFLGQVDDRHVVSHQDYPKMKDEEVKRSPDAEADERDLGRDDEREDDGTSTDDEDGVEDDTEKPTRAMQRKAATSSHAVDVDFDDDESWGDFGDAASESLDDDDDDDEEEDDASVILAGAPSATSTPPSAVIKKGHKSVLDRRKWPPEETSHPDAMASPPTSSLVSKLFPKLKPTQGTSQPRKEKMQVEQPPAKVSQPSVAEGLQSKLLKEKLVELEAEITKFRRENATLAKLREEREKGLAALDKEVVDFQKLKAEEMKTLQDYKEEEMRKIRKEKRTFEKYQKATRALPDKKDREEMELLKKQLADLQEEISRRETRWTAASTRLRDRTDILEKENAELREEVKLLEQQRLQAWRRQEEKLKSNQSRQQVPAINKQRLPPLSSILDDDLRPDVKAGVDIQREAVIREHPKAAPPPSTAPAQAIHKVTNAKLENVTAKPAAVSSSDDEAALSSKPRRPSQRKRSVRFSCDDDSPGRHPSVTARTDDSLDSSSPTRDDGLYQTALAASPKAGLDSRGRQANEQQNRSWNNNNEEDHEEIHHPDGKIEEVRSDGSRVITYSNQTRKEISADGQSVVVTFCNGDVKQILPDQRVMYYYAETQATHTTYPDGLEVIQFSNNQTEKHYPNGTKEITFPDQTIKYLFPNGNEESIFPDGTVLRAEKNGDRTMEFPNGQREVHTAQYKRREYPDGTIKTVYPDGRQETRYSSGRIRVKDKEGRVILDKK